MMMTLSTMLLKLSMGGVRQHMILPKFPKNCMKLKEFGPEGWPLYPLRSATGKDKK